MESILSVLNPKSLLLLWKGIHCLSKTLTLNAPGPAEMLFVFHLVVHAEILTFISQNNNIGLVCLANVLSNSSLSTLAAFVQIFFSLKAGIIRFQLLILFPTDKCNLTVKPFVRNHRLRLLRWHRRWPFFLVCVECFHPGAACNVSASGSEGEPTLLSSGTRVYVIL